MRADHAADQLETLLPLVEGKAGVLVLTFADRLPESKDRAQYQNDFRLALGVPVFLLDTRAVDEKNRASIREAVAAQKNHRFRTSDISALISKYPSRKTSTTVIEKIVSQPLVALGLLLLPTVVAVTCLLYTSDAADE